MTNVADRSGLPSRAALTLAVGLLVSACSAGAIQDMPDGSHHAADAATADAPPPPVHATLLAPGTPSDAPTHFATTPIADPTQRATVDYPLDGVLFPRNVFAPDVQWEGEGQSGDIFRVAFQGPVSSLTAYVLHTGSGFRFDYAVDPASWHALLASSAGMDLTLTVDRWIAARDVVIAGAPIHVRIARGSIAGAVYYWQLGSFHTTEGRILRVMQGTDTAPSPDNFMPQPPPRSDGARCAACHGLSRDGNRLAVSIGDGAFGGVFDLTRDLTGPNPPAIFTTSQHWYFAAFNPDGTRLFMVDPMQHTFLLDGNTGRSITPASGSLPDGTHPAWSPDGASIAYISSANDAWDVRTGNLSSLPVVAGDGFGAPSVLHHGSDLASEPEGGTMDAYPSYSPDSRVIAFQHGTGVHVTSSSITGALYEIPRGGGTPVRLTRASTGSTEGDAYYPNFTPFITPGFDPQPVYWLLFYSARDYGNTLAGTKGTRRRQIWVTAVSTDASSGDPSNVPYWLPGQDVAQENASAFWAPVACRAINASCESDGQCCSGHCITTTNARQACQPPPSTQCRNEGQSCDRSSDCCGASLACAGGLCVPTPP